MKRMKKLFAILMTMAMVMGLGITGFAAISSSIDIPISEAGSEATFEWLQVIAPDEEEATGWTFTSNEIASDFTEALNVEDDQTAIWMLIGNADENATLPEGIKAATASQVATAMANVKAGNYTLQTTDDGKKVTVGNAGVYYIEGTEEGYSYSPMAAYVSFGYTNGEPTSLSCSGVTAKRVPNIVTKEASADKDVTEIDRIETFTVTPSIVPYIAENELNSAKYMVTDTISGAEYVLDNDRVKLDVTIGTDPVTERTFYGTVSATQNGQSFTADLSSLLADNQFANKSITITYKATVKDTRVNNTVSIGDGTNTSKYGTSSEALYTAKIELVKYAADDDNDNVDDNVELQNAEFKVYKLVNENDKSVKYFAQATHGKLTGWTTIEANAATFVTDENGKISLEGLDAGEYYFTETKAPEGYSRNTNDEKVVISRPTQDATETTILSGSVNFFNDTISELPSTGGMGTTLFTIAGCVIMISAAGLFFATRKKAN